MFVDVLHDWFCECTSRHGIGCCVRQTTCIIVLFQFQFTMVYCQLLCIYGSIIQIFWPHTNSNIVHIQYLAKYSRCRQPRHNGTILHTLQHNKSCYSSEDHRNCNPGIPSQSQATASTDDRALVDFFQGRPLASEPQRPGRKTAHKETSCSTRRRVTKTHREIVVVDWYQIILIKRHIHNRWKHYIESL